MRTTGKRSTHTLTDVAAVAPLLVLCPLLREEALLELLARARHLLISDGRELHLLAAPTLNILAEPVPLLLLAHLRQVVDERLARAAPDGQHDGSVAVVRLVRRAPTVAVPRAGLDH